MDINKYISENQSHWQEFEKLLHSTEALGLSGLRHEKLKQFGILYRKISSDLVQVRSATSNPELIEYLNDLVSRGYTKVYSGKKFRIARVWNFFVREFPIEFRRNISYFLLSAAILLSGALLGFLAVTYDQNAKYYLMPDEHMYSEPGEHVRNALESEEAGGRIATAEQASAFSSFLFTNNIKVALLAFAAGITLGIGTVLVLFLNGAMLGAVAASYHKAGYSLFFYAWILPHGITELTSIVIAGGAGLLIGRALIWPGAYKTMDSMQIRGRSALMILLGTIPLFILAGLIEGSLSQMNPPRIPYWFKLAVAAATGGFLILYLGFAGRKTNDQRKISD